MESFVFCTDKDSNWKKYQSSGLISISFLIFPRKFPSNQSVIRKNYTCEWKETFLFHIVPKYFSIRASNCGSFSKYWIIIPFQSGLISVIQGKCHWLFLLEWRIYCFNPFQKQSQRDPRLYPQIYCYNKQWPGY